MNHPTATKGLQPEEIDELDALLAQVPPPLAALDLMALDGYLAGVLLQPRRIAASQWERFVTDEAGRRVPPHWAGLPRLLALVRQRHAELDRLIDQRHWFDPWITDVDEAESAQAAVQPWVLGFATACAEFPDLTEGPGHNDPARLEALAQLFQHLDPDDLEDAEALLAEIDTLEPPTTLEDAVESLVRGCLLLADESRPRPPARGMGTGTGTGARSSAGMGSGSRTGNAPGPRRTQRRPPAKAGPRGKA